MHKGDVSVIFYKKYLQLKSTGLLLGYKDILTHELANLLAINSHLIEEKNPNKSVGIFL